MLRRAALHVAVLSAFLCALAGCRSTARKSSWLQAVSGQPVVTRTSLSPAAVDSLTPPLGSALANYQQAVDEERAGRSACVDFYFEAALQAGMVLEQVSATEPSFAGAWAIHHAALSRLIVAGQCFSRLDPSGRLTIQRAQGPVFVPITHLGFPWQPSDFQSLLPIGERTVPMARHHRWGGLGVPVVVRRSQPRGTDRSPFLRDRAVFAGTVVLRSSDPNSQAGPGALADPVLEIVDPVRIRHVPLGGRPVPLAGDLSAPLAVIAAEAPDTGVQGFFNPAGVPADALGLVFLEPYQPGKIPIIFVHGLFSDPTTWLDLVNDLRAHPEVVERYQFWAFRYATGQPFVKSAAELRRDSHSAMEFCDPARRDPALQRTVLIGHSLGGLLAKLQVTHSDHHLWSAVSSCPPESLCLHDQTRAVIHERFFFEPQPFVKRVIFIGTPHRGSSFATRLAGRLASSLVTQPETEQRMLKQAVRDNPGKINSFVAGRLPNSVDMLQPNNPALDRMQLLRVDPCVPLHSIIGTGRTMLIGGPADGVVTVQSARHPNVASEHFVDARHSELHRHPQTVREVLRLLAEHQAGPSGDRSD